MWEKFEHRDDRTEIWFRFPGGDAGDWERPNGQRLKSLLEAEKIGWTRIGPCSAPGMPDENDVCELPSCSSPSWTSPVNVQNERKPSLSRFESGQDRMKMDENI